MSALDGLADARVQIAYADMARMNKIRAWARRNGARVMVERYTRDAYSGHVVIPSPWNVGRDETLAKAAELRSLLVSLNVRERY